MVVILGLAVRWTASGEEDAGGESYLDEVLPTGCESSEDSAYY